MLLTVYRPLGGIHGPLFQHLKCRSSLLLTRGACVSLLYANAVLVHDALTGTHGGSSGISATLTIERLSSVTFENLSRKWNIGLKTAKQTI